jgi:hypothetical protein
MDKTEILNEVRRLTGSLTRAASAPHDAVRSLERSLSTALLAAADPVVTGFRLDHESAVEANRAVEDTTARFAHLDDLFETSAPGTSASASTAAPLVFRRETAFRSDLAAMSMPAWSAGMAPSQSLGPFVDANGKKVWFDFFAPIQSLRFTIAGSTGPSLLIPVIRFRSVSQRSFRVQPGSVWIASNLLGPSGALDGYYTGLRVKGGSLQLSRDATVAGDDFTIDATATWTLHLDLDEQAAHSVAPSPVAGLDATASTLQLPATFEMRFVGRTGTLVTGPASCKAFGGEARFSFPPATTLWAPAIGRILIRGRVELGGNAPDTFFVESSQSTLCSLDGHANLNADCGWLLPATKLDPTQLGTAAGTGALCIGLDQGLTVTWKGLKGSTTRLLRPAILVDPDTVAIVDFFASNPGGWQRWTLWQNLGRRHHSDVTLGFAPLFAMTFIESRADSEALFFFCSQRSSFDRPIDGNGQPFEIASPVAFAAMLQDHARVDVMLSDTDLAVVDPAAAYAFHPLALRNAFFELANPDSVFVSGELTGDSSIGRGSVALTFPILRYLPTLPDPYVASYTGSQDGGIQDQRTSVSFGRLRSKLAGHVKWPDPSSSAKSTDDDQDEPPNDPAYVYFRLVDVDPPPRPAAVANVAIADGAHGAPPDFRSVSVFDRSLIGAATTVSDAAARSAILQTVRQALEPSRPPSDPPGDLFRLLDVSTHADQTGVGLGPAFTVEQQGDGNANLRRDVFLGANTGTAATSSASGLQVMNMDVVAPAANLRAMTLPQISWEPMWNEGLPGTTEPMAGDGFILHHDDGIPTRLFSESPHLVPIAPLPVTRHFVKEFDDPHRPRTIRSSFTLPFGLEAQADFARTAGVAPTADTRVAFHRPRFAGLEGGLQIRVIPPVATKPLETSASFPGWTRQLEGQLMDIRGAPLASSTLGPEVQEIFNNDMYIEPTRRVPLEGIELSGYGASMFSHWHDEHATVASVSQALFDVLVGRTAREVVQVRSILYPFGVRVVRTITLTRAANGYVHRSDSGWKAESDGKFDFSYSIEFGPNDVLAAPNPYVIHPEPINFISNVREIRDIPDGRPYTTSLSLSELTQPLPTPLHSKVSSLFLSGPIAVELQPVVFDADVHLDHVVSRAATDSATGAAVVQSRRMMGYVQIKPHDVLIPPKIFADLLDFQQGSLGGPVDCIVDIGKSGQRMRIVRVDVSAASGLSGQPVFAAAARGSLILPPDGSWSTVVQRTDTGDVSPIPAGASVPLIRPNGAPDFRIASPKDVEKPASGTRYGVLQSTGTQKLLFDTPHFEPGKAKMQSAGAYFADAFHLLNSKGPFPNVAHALSLPATHRVVDILGEGAMKMDAPTIDLGKLLPTKNFRYPIVELKDVVKVYAEYAADGAGANDLSLSFDSGAVPADRWKAALSNVRLCVGLGPFDKAMWVDGNLDAGSEVLPTFDKPRMQLDDALQKVKDILRVLAELSGDDFDDGMDVSMSNAPDTWEYKFSATQEIPVIRFPSPFELSVNPNPVAKLEAGLSVGFYFNEVLSLHGDLKQLLPACGAILGFYGRMEVMAFTLGPASIYAVGQANVTLSGDTRGGRAIDMKIGVGAEIVVGLPFLANVAVMYMAEVAAHLGDDGFAVTGLVLFRGHVEICSGLVGITIQIEAGGSIARRNNEAGEDATEIVAQVSFTIDVCVIWVIDLDHTWEWEERRRIA